MLLARPVSRQGVPASGVLVETTSYDTIGNAYFARTNHIAVAGYKKILVITSDFHMGAFGVRAPAFELAVPMTPQRRPWQRSWYLQRRQL